MFLANCRPAKNDFTILLFHHIINLKIVPVVQFVCAMRRKLWSTATWEADSHLGTGHYLSPGGRSILGGITWFLGKQKGGSVVTENSKGGIAENFGRVQRGDHSNLVGKWRHGGGGGGSRKSSKVIRGHHFSEVLKHSKGESVKFYPLLSPKSSAPTPNPQAISNDWSLKREGASARRKIQPNP